eukprot:2524086-Alexandrium_andersonii.AAC.1
MSPRSGSAAPMPPPQGLLAQSFAFGPQGGVVRSHSHEAQNRVGCAPEHSSESHLRAIPDVRCAGLPRG